MLFLSERDLRTVLSMAEVIAAVESAFKLIAAGLVHMPERLHLEMPGRGILLEMPAWVEPSDVAADELLSDCSRFQEHRLKSVLPESVLRGALGTKIVSVLEKNRERGLDVVQASYLLLDSETGETLALMGGRYITAIRTAAASAVATRLMATAGPKRLAVLGAGVQAAFHIQAMNEVVDLERVSICSRTDRRARELAVRVALEWNVQADVVGAVEAASTSNLICTCTTSPSPLFDGRLVVDGAHINAVGAFSPATRELDTETVRRARVIIDSESAAGREAGDILIPINEGAIRPHHVKGALADVISGKVAPRTSPNEVTLFKSCGLAVEDLVTAQLAYRKATAGGIGTRLEA